MPETQYFLKVSANPKCKLVQCGQQRQIVCRTRSSSRRLLTSVQAVVVLERSYQAFIACFGDISCWSPEPLFIGSLCTDSKKLDIDDCLVPLLVMKSVNEVISTRSSLWARFVLPHALTILPAPSCHHHDGSVLRCVSCGVSCGGLLCWCL